MEQTVQRRVRIIPAKRDTDTPQPGKKKHQRVAAYCRVSTDSGSPATRRRKPTTPRRSRRIQTGSWPASLLMIQLYLD